MVNTEALEIICTRLGFIPDRTFLDQVPYWAALVRDAENNGGIDAALKHLAAKGIFAENTVEIPHHQQARIGATIARDKKRMELSRPGTRKTISALCGLDAILRNHETNGRADEPATVLISCPGYIIPTWLREIERLYKKPNSIVITRRNRKQALERASEPTNKFVIVSHSMSFRNAQDITHTPEDYLAAATQFRHRKELLLQELTRTIGPERTSRHEHKSFDELMKIHMAQRDLAESDKIMDSLRKRIFVPEHPQTTYTIIDEFHNIINPSSQTGRVLADMFRQSEYGLLISGTGIANDFDNLRFAAYLMRLIDDPKLFGRLVKKDPKRVKAFLDLYTIKPTMRLEQVDAQVPPLETSIHHYQPSTQQLEIITALQNCDLFDDRQLYQLITYALDHPSSIETAGCEGGNGPESLTARLEQFFDSHPLRTSVQTTLPAKLDLVKNLVAVSAREGRKAIIACEYTTDIADMLVRELAAFGALKIDQTISAEPAEIALTKEDIKTLQHIQGTSFGPLYDGSQTLRSALTLDARLALGIKNHEIIGMSEREKIIMEFATNPQAHVMIAGYKSFREGVDCQEASLIIPYDITTVPAWFFQLVSRARRSGQRKTVQVQFPIAQGTLEEGRYRRLQTKRTRNEEAEFGDDLDGTELQEWHDALQPERSPEISPYLGAGYRATIRMLFTSLVGKGAETFAQQMLQGDNARLFAHMYNYDYDTTYGANVQRCLVELITALEHRRGRFENILDAGGGPNALSRTIRRPTTIVDIVRYQHDFGIQACKDLGIRGCKNYLGDISNLNRLLEVNAATAPNLPAAFDPSKTHVGETGLANKSEDLIVTALVLSCLSPQERLRFTLESNRTLTNEGYLLIAEPLSKVEQTCKPQLLADIIACGFDIDSKLTGTYQARRVQDLDHDKGGTVETYVIVARKREDVTSASANFIMLNTYEIKVAQETEDRIGPDKGPRARLHGSQFYNKDTDVSPDQNPRFEPYEPPRRPHQPVITPESTEKPLREGLIENLGEANADDIEGLLDKLNDRLGGTK